MVSERLEYCAFYLLTALGISVFLLLVLWWYGFIAKDWWRVRGPQMSGLARAVFAVVTADDQAKADLGDPSALYVVKSRQRRLSYARSLIGLLVVGGLVSWAATIACWVGVDGL